MVRRFCGRDILACDGRPGVRPGVSCARSPVTPSAGTLAELEGSVHNVAITGLGIISSLGLNVDDHSRRLLNG